MTKSSFFAVEHPFSVKHYIIAATLNNRHVTNMKKILFILSILAFNISFAEDTKQKDGEVVVTETIDGAKIYGDNWKVKVETIAIDVALNNADKNIGKQLIFTGNIGKVCQNTGCWMTLEQNGMFARVEFNSHAFFIPKDSSGKAEAYGVLSSKMMSEEKRKHLEEEGAGKMPEKVFEITATSLKIYNTESSDK
ncbi:MAG: DUF4920 domain-containing protein [Proteobacteria bacterium]|nr:DUF4920 domain-containing protein [Pseudomonadota bacterium]